MSSSHRHGRGLPSVFCVDRDVIDPQSDRYLGVRFLKDEWVFRRCSTGYSSYIYRPAPSGLQCSSRRTSRACRPPAAAEDAKEWLCDSRSCAIDHGLQGGAAPWAAWL